MAAAVVPGEPDNKPADESLVQATATYDPNGYWGGPKDGAPIKGVPVEEEIVKGSAPGRYVWQNVPGGKRRFAFVPEKQEEEAE